MDPLLAGSVSRCPLMTSVNVTNCPSPGTPVSFFWKVWYGFHSPLVLSHTRSCTEAKPLGFTLDRQKPEGTPNGAYWMRTALVTSEFARVLLHEPNVPATSYLECRVVSTGWTRKSSALSVADLV